MNNSKWEIVYSAGMAGIADDEGNVVVPCEYDKILNYDADGYVRLIRDNVWTTIDLEGRVCIDPKCGITHLGVFYEGTARARKDGLWGLVDVKGKAVTGFVYKNMNAHRDNGYMVQTADGKAGFVDDSGKFTPARNTRWRLPLEKIGAYHQGIAPALLYGKWVFVDRKQNLVNEISYDSMEPVMRSGLYCVRVDYNGEPHYNAARYDGTLINREKYCRPLHFEKGCAVCEKERDAGSAQHSSEDGQTDYVYGILKTDGSYLFPAEYTEIHWNDRRKKDCWFATGDDSRICYLLFPDGTCRIYDRSQQEDEGFYARIPPDELDHYTTGEEWLLRSRMERTTYKLRTFDADDFMDYLLQQLGCGGRQLQIYYRDTDAEIDVEKLYRPGTLLRAGFNMEVTRKLLRPVQRVRFLIASYGLVDMAEYRERYGGGDVRLVPFMVSDKVACHLSYVESCPDIDEYMVHKNDAFVVMDVSELCGVTQIVLLHVPLAALVLARRHHVPLGGLKVRMPDYTLLTTFARKDLALKMTETVHGHSLSARWISKMHRPIGLDETMRPYSLARAAENTAGQDRHMTLDLYHQEVAGDYMWQWDASLPAYTSESGKSIEVVQGDISKLCADAVVEAIRPQRGCKTGQSRITGGRQRLYREKIGCAVPQWKGGGKYEAGLLASCYSTALLMAVTDGARSIVFPCLGTATGHFPRQQAARIAVRAVLRHLGDYISPVKVIFCCADEEDAAACNVLLGKADLCL